MQTGNREETDDDDDGGGVSSVIFLNTVPVSERADTFSVVGFTH